MSLLKNEQELLFSWQTFSVILLLFAIMQFNIVIARTTGFGDWKENIQNIRPVKVAPAKPVQPVRPRFLSLVITDEKVKHNQNDVFCLAKNIYHEAGHEPKIGKYAVAQVTLNRMKSPKYADKVCSVVYDPYQFSWANRHAKRYTVPKGPNWDEAKKIAVEVLKGGKRVHGLDNVMYYHATYVKPSWSHKKSKVAKIGLHIFYR